MRLNEGSKSSALISILDIRSPLTRPDFAKFKYALEMSFKDREELGTEEWPDLPTKKFNREILGDSLEKVFDLNDAHKIITFFEMISKDDSVTKLVVHCKSGVSRSPAIAYWLARHYNVQNVHSSYEDDRLWPNGRVLRLLDKALNI